MSDKLFSDTPRAPVRTVDSTPASDTNSENIDYIAALSKDGKPPDLNALAKKAYHADAHVRNLEQENEGMRKELDQRLSYEDLIDQIKAMRESKPGTPPVETPEHVEKPNAALTPEQLSKLVRDTLNQESTRRTAEQNTSEVKKTLEQQWGRDYQRKLLDKASELGVTQAFLEQTAATSPQALYRLVGAAEAPNPRAAEQNNSAPPHSTIDGNKLPNNRVTGKRLKDFDELRKTDPRTYWSAKFQSELHKLARDSGEDFYK